ncbi:ATP-dependent DNA ligase [Streptomyces oceani]|uniref:Probable DNA ligase n=1 Tax=Streptomyces oceani TaxID=1075402 RepID=A0A1E7KMM3_9ACTN|nr:ATP-dependent DNA ligase [Streptomyces oceani]OEV05157.1 ATP-dependent DNA ligase [Streptomyces oceani]
MLLADLARTSLAVTAASARTRKVALLARLLRETEPTEAPIVVTYLAGRLPQRRTGVGWRSLTDPPTPAATARLTVYEVHAALDALATVAGRGAQAERRRLLHELLAAATAEEQDFLIRLIGGELRQGALDALAVEALAAAAEASPEAVRRAVMLGGSLGAVARALLGRGPEALAEFRLEVGRPVLPMLARSAKDVDEALDRLGACALEEKLDGVRVQAHRSGRDVRLYSRTLEELTDRLPEVVAAVREVDAESAVLDGEAIALGQDGRPRPFQETSARIGARLDIPGASESLPISVAFFDLLYVDGRDLLDLPARQRQSQLERVVPATLRVRRTEVVPEPAAEARPGPEPAAEPVPTDEAGPVPGRAEAREFAAAALAGGQEGVLVKSLDTPYSAGRRGATWLKVKPVRTLDLVVLGAEWGHGRRTGTLSNLHLGARAADGSYAMLGKTFKGLTDALLAWQTERLPRIAVRHEPWGVVVRPELVVEVAYDGVQRSSRYPAGVTLRFARVVRYREDKPAAEADTVDAVLAALPPS